MASIGERIAKRRAELRMTQGQLAKFVKVSRAAVSQWENGDTKGLKPENLVACADALRMSIRELATGRPGAPDTALGTRVAALPMALRQHIAEEIQTAEQAARAVPFAFTAPVDPSRLDDFHRYLGSVREQLRQQHIRPKPTDKR
jgi:transcriptional regulator with XRE-family HTH domain